MGQRAGWVRGQMPPGQSLAWPTPGKAQCSERECFTTSTSSIFLMLFLQMAPSWFRLHL